MINDGTLAIVVPVFNEERRLPGFFDRLWADGDRAAAAARLRLLEIVVVDDGSTDATGRILGQEEHVDARLHVIRLPRNRGKGAAVRAGVLAAEGDLVLVTDVDLSTPLGELSLLRSEIDRGADIAIGSRALAESNVVVHQARHRELMGKTFNLMFRLLTRLPLRDTQCGFKLFRRERTSFLFELQRVDRFAYDAELCLNAHLHGVRVAEVPVTWRNDVDTHVTLLGSSLRMALDLGLMVWRVRRPTERRR